MQPHRRKRKKRENENDDKIIEESPERKGPESYSKDSKDTKIKPKPKPAPPPMSFSGKKIFLNIVYVASIPRRK